MEMRQLGRTDVAVSALGLGGMPLSLSGRPPRSQAIQVIHRALDLGISLIDTADSYCKDESDKHHNERLIAEALQTYPGDTQHVVVATKGGLMRPQGDWTHNGHPDHLRQTIRISFRALGGEKPIDLWQYHAPDPSYSLKESLAPVKEAVEAGIIRYVGVSNFSVAQLEQAREIVEIVSVQNQYNLLHRQPEEDGVLEYCEREGLTFFPYRPLLGRFRVHEIHQIPGLSDVARARKASVYCIALAWLRAKSPVVIPIPGATQFSSIEDSVQAVKIQLSADEVQQIERGVAEFCKSQQSWHWLPGLDLVRSAYRKLFQASWQLP